MTLSYELCLKLKEAGFPQHAQPRRACYYDCFNDENEEGLFVPFVCKPTLSELIKACGEAPHLLLQRDRYNGAYSHGSWLSIGDWYDEQPWNEDDLTCAEFWANAHEELVFSGDSPEEAVAKLYLNYLKLND